MNRILCFLCLFAGIAAAPSLGQAPKQLAQDALVDAEFLRAYAETRGFMLGRPVKAKPTPDGKAVLFLRSEARAPQLRLYEFDVASGKTRELLTPEQVLKGAAEKLTPEEKARRERMRVSLGGFTDFQLSEDGTQVLLSLSGKLYVFQRSQDAPPLKGGDGGVLELKTAAGTILDPKLSPDGKSVAFVRDYDVWVYDLASEKERQVTKGGTETVAHGLAEFVAQEEMNRFSGYWWSPDSQKIAYEEADAREVEVWHVSDPAHPEQPALKSFYPRPGRANVKVRLGIVPVAGGDTVWVEWDVKKYPYLAQVRWDKHGPLTISVQTRLQNELALLKVDPATGKTTALLTEHDPTWVNLHPNVPCWRADGRDFLWVSETKVGPQLEFRGADGKKQGIIVAAENGFRGLISVSSPGRVRDSIPLASEGGDIVYQGSTLPFSREVDPLSATVLHSSIGLPGGVKDQTRGWHTAAFNAHHSLMVLTSTTPGKMPKSTVYRDEERVGELPSVAETPPFTPRVELITVGEDPKFYAALVRPRNFDPKKRYPVIVDVYGGPGHQLVTAAMRNWLLPQWLADQGFIVVSIDGRGTPSRGRGWERAIYKKFGSVPLDDQVAGLQALGKKFPEMDLERVGITGWSFGGYLSALAVLKRPDVFRAAAAGAPVVDWLDYDTHYTERYLGLPDADAAAYKEASLLTYAADLQRPLLLLHGTADDNVYFRHSLRLVNALFRAGKDFEVLPLSGLTHMVPDPVVNERLWSKIALFFRKHLGQPTG